MGLTLDEFALWLHLEDVYWAEEGRSRSTRWSSPRSSAVAFSSGSCPSTRARSSTVAIVVSVLSPGDSARSWPEGQGQRCVVGMFIPPVAWVGAMRLARPAPCGRGGATAGQREARQGEARKARHDRRVRRFQDLIGGTPSLPSPRAARAQNHMQLNSAFRQGPEQDRLVRSMDCRRTRPPRGWPATRGDHARCRSSRLRGDLAADCWTLNILYGIGAVADANFYVDDTRYILTNLHTLGWVLIILGVIQLTGGFSLMAGNPWGRFVGIVGGSLGAIGALLSMGDHHPFWELGDLLPLRLGGLRDHRLRRRRARPRA